MLGFSVEIFLTAPYLENTQTSVDARSVTVNVVFMYLACCAEHVQFTSLFTVTCIFYVAIFHHRVDQPVN